MSKVGGLVPEDGLVGVYVQLKAQPPPAARCHHTAPHYYWLRHAEDLLGRRPVLSRLLPSNQTLHIWKRHISLGLVGLCRASSVAGRRTSS